MSTVIDSHRGVRESGVSPGRGAVRTCCPSPRFSSSAACLRNPSKDRSDTKRLLFMYWATASLAATGAAASMPCSNDSGGHWPGLSTLKSSESVLMHNPICCRDCATASTNPGFFADCHKKTSSHGKAPLLL